jgi:hypothetical protein
MLNVAIQRSFDKRVCAYAMQDFDTHKPPSGAMTLPAVVHQGIVIGLIPHVYL